MIDLPGYRLGELLYTSPKSLVHRAVRLDDDRRVVVKVPNTTRPSLRHIAAYERAFRIARATCVDGVVEHIDLVRYRGGYCLITDDIDAVSVDVVLRLSSLTLDRAVEIGLVVARSLGDLHARGVVHKDIKPSNIIHNAETGRTLVIDLGLSTWLDSERVAGSGDSQLEGTLAYMSPEQTGRMNRSVDYRTDLYSLGVTLYEMIAGSRPFLSFDPIELVHAHIARVPEPLHSVRRDVPRPLSDLVARLLAKSADERYQSAWGVAADLAWCLESLTSFGRIDPFELGQHDVSSRFRLPEVLYGREVELGQLLEAFELCVDGGKAMVTVAGYSGIGKTSIVLEMQRPVVEQRGWFCTGKFDQFTRDVPYTAVTQAIEDLVRQVRMRPLPVVEALRNAVLEAVGPNGGVLVEVVPELERLIGSVPPPPVLGPAEAQIRFHRVVLQFVRVFARREHPLVLFLDDLQWADAASLELLELLAGDPSTGHVLLLGGFRDNEVGRDHRLQHSLDRLHDEGLPVFRITLPPLSPAHVHQLFCDVVGATPAQAATTAEILHRKTGGNPFFLRELLHALHRRGSIVHDVELRRWDWDDVEIASVNVTDNVVDLVTSRLGELPGPTRDLLATAACIGAEFVLGTLAIVSELPVADTAQRLVAALRAGVLIPLDSEYKFVEAAGEFGDETLLREVARVRYRFQHDRVQQAAHAQLDESEKNARHRHIGLTLWSHLPVEERARHVVDIANHLNHAAHQLSDPDERSFVADCNLAAGEAAIRSLAHATAWNYLSCARQLLAPDCWRHDYARALRIHERCVEAALATGRFDEVARLANVVHAHARRLVDRTTVWVLQLRAEQSRARYAEGVDLALRILQEFDVRLPRRPTQAAVLREVARTGWVVRGAEPESFARLAPMSDPEKLALLSILGAAIPPAYFAEPNLLPILAMNIVRTSIRWGNAGQSGYGYAVYGLVLSGALGFHANGYEWGRVGSTVAELFSRFDRARANYVLGIFLHHLRHPMAVTEEMLLRGWADCLDVGDEESAVYSAGVALHYAFLGGAPLTRAIERHRESMLHVQESAQYHVKESFVAWYQLAELLVSDAPPFDRLAGERFDIDEALPRFRAAHNGVQVAISAFAAGVYEFLCGRWARADALLGEALSAKTHILGQILVPTLHWLHALNRLIDQSESREPVVSRARALRCARAAVRTIRRWSSLHPPNHEARILVLQAEILVVEGAPGERVLAAFESAARAAVETGATWEEALSWERAAAYAERLGLRDLSAHMAPNARNAWERWGCALRRGDTAARVSAPVLSESSHWTQAADVEQTHESSEGPSIDFGSLVRAVRNISGEIDLDRLTDRTVELILENAGANLGFLALEEGGQIVVYGYQSTDDPSIRSPRAASIETLSGVPTELLRYVLRYREQVVIDDAQRSEWLVSAPELERSPARTIACVPVQLQRTMLGVLYLENHHLQNAFRHDHLEFITVLAGQAAVAIENARLYADAQRALRQQSALAQANQRFVPIEFIQGLGRDDITHVEPGDAVHRHMTVLFVDIRGFTTLSETLSPAETVRFVNDYVRHVQPEVAHEGGFIDSFSGDGILALFPAEPSAAVRAALRIVRAVTRFNLERAERGQPEIRVGIGINAGTLTMGTVGNESRLQATVLGDTVNVASRVEGLTRVYGADVLVTETALDGIDSDERYLVRRIGRVEVAGRRAPVSLHEVLERDASERVQAMDRVLDTFHAAVDASLRGDLNAARLGFSQCIEACPTDAVARWFLAQVDASESHVEQA